MLVPRSGGATRSYGISTSKNALQKTGRSLRKILERLSTGQRINRASDDAAGLAVSEQLRTQARGFKMASANISDAMSALNIADGTSGQVADALQRQRELAIQARNDTLTDDQRAALDLEYQALNAEIDRIAGNARFNTQNVSGGEDLADGTGQVQAGPNSGDAVTLPEIDLTTAALGTDITDISTQSSAATALRSVDEALNALGTQRATLGATYNRFESIQNNLAIAEINTQAAESVLRDQDMAEGITDLTTSQLLQEGSMRAFARFQEISANHLFGLLQ